ncbi:MAG: DUF937 domain-containing protein [Myxococcota bacterium]|nr:DUF937 domain-containing protein [Myxococcota bacterium]
MGTIVNDILDELGDGTLSKVGSSLGLSTDETQTAVAAALPALISGLATNASQPEGASQLAAALDKNHGPSLLDSLGPLAGALLGGSTGRTGGGGFDLGSLLGGLGSIFGGRVDGGRNSADVPSAVDAPGILGHIFGGQTTGVTDKISKATGLDAKKIGMLLLVLAPIVMSALANRRKKQKLDTGELASSLRNDAESLGAGPPPNTKHASEAGFLDKLSNVLRGKTGVGGIGDLFRN